VPRFDISRYRPSDNDFLDPHDDDDGVSDHLDAAADDPRRRPGRTIPTGRRLVAEGRSGRTTVEQPEPEQASYSSYDIATHGPTPAPDWLITSLSAEDTSLGVLKSGKEADVGLLDRSLPGGPGCLLAVKTYRDSNHRMFHRDSGYQEGRRTRRSREGRAMAARTAFGRDLLSAKWAGSEFAVLSTLWKAGARVPYPVQILGSELMMEFVGDPDGVAAPRLATWEGDTQDFGELWHDLVTSLETLAAEGLTHGDLSPYNVLVQDGVCVVIDLPQAVDVVANPQGDAFLQRDCRVIADFFAKRGVLAADGELLALHLGGIARR
jgi:RIO kinase 1